MSSSCSSAGARGDMQQAKFVYSESPHPWTRGIRVRVSNAFARSVGSGADETMTRRRLGTFSAEAPAASSMGNSVGTTLVTATDSARITCAHVKGSSRSQKTRCPPVVSAVMSPKPNACAW